MVSGRCCGDGGAESLTVVRERAVVVSNMSLLFVAKMPLTYTGGAEVSTRYLASVLARRGHDVAIVSSRLLRTPRGVLETALFRAMGLSLRQDLHTEGSQTSLSADPVAIVRRRVRESPPDIVVVTGTDPKFARAALQSAKQVASVLYVRVEAAASVPSGSHVDVVVSNSRFMAGMSSHGGNRAEFLPSMFPREIYTLSPSRERVLFVNPVPKKGVDVALDLAARRPDIPFAFNLSWRMKSSAVRVLRERARMLGNVDIRMQTRDPARLFRDARIVIVPSQCRESWGRVVTEAHFSGIPVIASDIGGLPEAVGPGGILVPPDSRDDWARALSTVWDDVDRYERLSRAALEYSCRPEIDVDVIASRFEELLYQAIARHEHCRSRSLVNEATA
jgi:glycosyltransferase involved in cell wall biosynthesis